MLRSLVGSEMCIRDRMDADAGCHWSQSLIINAEEEKEQISDAIDAMAIANCLVI